MYHLFNYCYTSSASQTEKTAARLIARKKMKTGMDAWIEAAGIDPQ